MGSSKFYLILIQGRLVVGHKKRGCICSLSFINLKLNQLGEFVFHDSETDLDLKVIWVFISGVFPEAE